MRKHQHTDKRTEYLGQSILQTVSYKVHLTLREYLIYHTRYLTRRHMSRMRYYSPPSPGVLQKTQVQEVQQCLCILAHLLELHSPRTRGLHSPALLRARPLAC